MTEQISIRQSFRLNGENHYTIFDVPISVTNSIEEEEDERPSCGVLTNELLSPEDIDIEGANEVGVFLAPDDATEIEFDDAKNGNGDGDADDDADEDGDDDDDPDFGGQRPEAGPEDGLGPDDAAVSSTLSWSLLLASIVIAAVGA